MQARKLTPEQFDGSLLPIFQAIKAEVVGSRFDANYFFRTWRQWMRNGVAHAWTAPGVVLGATLTPDLFSGDVQAMVVFWFSLPEARGQGDAEKVFRAFEQHVKDFGAKAIYGAAYNGLNHQKRSEGYEKHGFEFIESTFRKRLTN